MDTFTAYALRLSLWLAALLLPLLVHAGSSSSLESNLRGLYERREFDTKSVGPVTWLERGDRYLLLESSVDGIDLVCYEASTGKREVVITAAQLREPNSTVPLEINRYAFAPEPTFALSPDEARVLVATNTRKKNRVTLADYWLFDRKAATLSQIATDVQVPDLESAFSPDGFQIVYAHAHNLFSFDIRSSKVIQLTSDGVEGNIGNGVNDWGWSFIRWSPDGALIAYSRNDVREVGLFPLLDNTKAVYPEPDLIRFPKVGTPIPKQRVGVVSADGNSTRWVNMPEKPAFYLDDVIWAPNSRQIAIPKLARSKDRLELLLADATTSEVRLAHQDDDPAWVLDRFAREPGFRWIKNGKAFTWLEEQDGWRRAYVVSRDTDRLTLLTPGQYDVTSLVAVDESLGWLYYMASPSNATQSYLYRARLDGSGRAERVTPESQPGTHSYDVSPNARWALHTYSTADNPPVTTLIKLPGHQAVRIVEDNAQLRTKLAAMGSRPTEFLQLDIGGGVVMDAWMLKPKDFDPTEKYPVFVFVYGEPASQTVTDSWSIGQRKQLFHRAIADAGYIVVSMDNRGTPAPKGSAWRRAVFGSLGPLSTEEQAAGLRELARTRPYVDLSRVGIWGWSAGGTNTLNALFRKPDQYHVGIAVAPKPRADLYNAWFQETFMRTPDVNPEGYRTAAPLNYAEGLKGKLLIIHGTGDDNSHLQIVEHLVNRLVELGKSFDYMTYPNRSHSINEGPGTTLHLYSLIARYLTEHLPAGGRERDARVTGTE